MLHEEEIVSGAMKVEKWVRTHSTDVEYEGECNGLKFRLTQRVYNKYYGHVGVFLAVELNGQVVGKTPTVRAQSSTYRQLFDRVDQERREAEAAVTRRENQRQQQLTDEARRRLSGNKP